jgi:hypothetical protein
MAQIPLGELQLQLATIQAAITTLVEGKRLSSLRVGSGTFQRLYQFQEINLEHLRELRDELLEAIAVIAPAEVTFKTNMHIPLIVSKEIF